MRIFTIRGLILFFLICIPIILSAQTSEFLRAKVLDQETGDPVVFATVSIKGKANGVITNMDGSFRLPIALREAGESIIISFMGYEKKEFALQKLSPNDINIIRLSPATISLSEAVVSAKRKRSGLSARTIVRKAISGIPNNYPANEFAAIGYYRDYQIKDDNYVNLNEAILEVVDKGFHTNDYADSKFRIYDYINNINFMRDAEGERKYDYKKFKKFIDKAYLDSYGGNEFTILRVHDAIRNYNVNSYDFVNILENDLLNNHYFKKENDIQNDNEVLYVISFKQSFLKYLVHGKLFIAKNNFAIHKMEYKLYDRIRKVENGQVDKQGIDNVAIFKVLTEYKSKYGKMYPNYISFFNIFEVGQLPEFIVKEVLLDGPKGCFIVKFNRIVEKESASKKGNYDIRFEDKKIEIDRIKVLETEVEVYPKLTDKDFRNLIYKMDAAQSRKFDLMKLLSAKVTDVRNLEGAKVDEMKYETYRQFREFFVQEIKVNGSGLKDTLFMKKDIPIFENQYIVKPDNFNEYWMNTPLKKISN
ncbi:carboxypeptidase-like regulatory domain-containing protein [Maribacter sp. MAR_2009_72]|uniref:carboxypeptidase-like regulatory domain-containing protein n=1 Tax=Maribacter sp. MAR_2009_72 TaxID=1250050 RepID=UPI001198FA79|nr:carboxypeptidase-like regulatory domain-containing protein [Maribacter sp. MAR_2009_72]TVZ17119.1 carboxypeptidase-like protein [Maribacter sp. MAR_2009_72]